MAEAVHSAFDLDSQYVYRARPFLAFPWLEHGFGTRLSAGFGADAATLRQIHSAIIVECPLASNTTEGDALISEQAGRLVGVRTADCLPVLLLDVRSRSVAAVHAGWRGTAQGIAARAAKALGARPGDIHAAIGPGIGLCCFEAGPEVAAEFSALFPERSDLNRRTHLDLEEANRRQLIQAGVAAGQIYTSGLCTFCRPEFHSYRRDGERAGRMMSVIGAKEKGREP